MGLWLRALFLAGVILAAIFALGAGLVWLHDHTPEVEPVPSGFEAPVRPMIDPPSVVESA
jgi:hypothetical protein